jgi:phi13 family phage major tail protein
MASIGYKKAKYNKIDAETKKYATLTEDKVPCLTRVIDEKFSPEYNSAELYADDGLAETDYSFKKGGLAITIADDDDERDAFLMGNTVTEGEVTKTIDDTAPEVGYGHIITKMVKGVKKYKVEFFPRVKFTKITTDGKTRGESVEFGTTSVEAIVYPLEADFNGMKAGTWEKHQTFATETEAEAYLDECLTPSAN